MAEVTDLASSLLPLNAGVPNSDEAVNSSSDRARRGLFVVLFCLPVIISLFYNFIMATPRYASEMAFVVRSLDTPRDRFSFLNIARSMADESNSEAVVAFIRSRSLLTQINEDKLLNRTFSERGLDYLSTFPTIFSGSTQEDFYRHTQQYIDADFDRATSITTVETQAFDPHTAKLLAERILRASEHMVNHLNDRARSDLAKSSERQVAEASAYLQTTLGRMNYLRNSERLIDPEVSTGAAIKLSSVTEAQVARLNVELAQTLRAAPDSPVLRQLRVRRAALQSELARQRNLQTGGTGALADRFKKYDELDVQREIAERRLLAASIMLVSARSSADRQRLYIELVAQPNLADEPLYPKAWLNLLVTILICGAFYWICRSLLELVISDE